jgi:hypothetical protein
LAGNVARFGREMNSNLVHKRQERKPLGRLRRKREDNIKVDLIEMGLWLCTGYRDRS